MKLQLTHSELYKQTFALRLTLFIGFGINVIMTNTAFHKKNATPLGKHCGVMVMDVGWLKGWMDGWMEGFGGLQGAATFPHGSI